jgi:type I protein arginine methyltransferase
VLDVGAGTGILSFFAAQAGARKVYAVEASNSAEVARELAEANGYSGIVEVIQGKLEEIELPERVDVIISEPIGFLLVHERMIESYVTARDKFLKPDGLMMPTTGSIVFSPLTDDYLYQEQVNKGQLWTVSRSLSLLILHCSLRTATSSALICRHWSRRLKLRIFHSQSLVRPSRVWILIHFLWFPGFFPLQSLISNSRTVHSVDFSTVTCQELQQFEIPYRFRIDRTGLSPLLLWLTDHSRSSPPSLLSSS